MFSNLACINIEVHKDTNILTILTELDLILGQGYKNLTDQILIMIIITEAQGELIMIIQQIDIVIIDLDNYKQNKNQSMMAILSSYQIQIQTQSYSNL